MAETAWMRHREARPPPRSGGVQTSRLRFNVHAGPRGLPTRENDARPCMEAADNEASDRPRTSQCTIVHGWLDDAPRGVHPSTMMNDRASELGVAVRRRREDLGLSQVELAELAAVSTRFVHTLEADKATLRLDKVLDVLQVLGLELRVTRGRGRLVET